MTSLKCKHGNHPEDCFYCLSAKRQALIARNIERSKIRKMGGGHAVARLVMGGKTQNGDNPDSGHSAHSLGDNPNHRVSDTLFG